jgi:hypothetical protein
VEVVTSAGPANASSGCFRWKDWDKQCRRLSSGVGLFQECVQVLWERSRCPRCSSNTDGFGGPCGPVSGGARYGQHYRQIVVGDLQFAYINGKRMEKPPHCCREWDYWLSRHWIPVGMGLDPSPSHTDGQYGTGMGLAHF